MDVALLPVGGWGPWLGPGHLDAGARRGAGPAGAARAVPVHYGTYWPIGMDGVRPARIPLAGRGVRAAGRAGSRPRSAVHLLGHGESARPEVSPVIDSVDRGTCAGRVDTAGGRLSVAVPAGGARRAGAGGADGGAGEFGGRGGLPPDVAVLAAAGLRGGGLRGASSATSPCTGSGGAASIQERLALAGDDCVSTRRPDRLAQAQDKLREHGVAVLVLSRLVPAGRIPVMLACLLRGVAAAAVRPGRRPGLSGLGGDVPADRDPRRLAVHRAVAGGGRGGRS